MLASSQQRDCLTQGGGFVDLRSRALTVVPSLQAASWAATRSRSTRPSRPSTGTTARSSTGRCRVCACVGGIKGNLKNGRHARLACRNTFLLWFGERERSGSNRIVRPALGGCQPKFCVRPAAAFPTGAPSRQLPAPGLPTASFRVGLGEREGGRRPAASPGACRPVDRPPSRLPAHRFYVLRSAALLQPASFV